MTPADMTLMRSLRELSVLVLTLARAKKRPKAISAFLKGDPDWEGHHGMYYPGGSIKIALRNKPGGKFYSYEELVDTLCHELAHMYQFNHGSRWKRSYEKLKGLAEGLI